MKTRICVTAAGLALATSLLAQTTPQQQQMLDKAKAEVQALLDAQKASGETETAQQKLMDKLKAQMEMLAAAARERQATTGTTVPGGRGGAAPNLTDIETLRQYAIDAAGLQLQVVGSPGVLGLPVSWEAPLIPGHPYSATARTVTMSPDGQHVDRSETEVVYRDDQGRTRREINGGRNISILDPASGVAYNLNSEMKTAMKRVLTPTSIATQSRAPNQSLLELATAQAKGRQNMTVDDLGTQVVNGVSAQGVRVSTIVPLGTFGNDRELKTVVDRWVSTDLHVLVKSVTTDSRTGSVNYDLTNLALGPPDASLFQVPAGYTVQEGGRGARGGMIMPAPTVPPARK